MSRRDAAIHSAWALCVMLLLPACSGDMAGPPDPTDPGVSADIGREGGEVRFGSAMTLYVPPDAVGAGSRFSIREDAHVPPPPSGCLQFGPAYVVDGPTLDPSLPVAVAIRPAYDRINDPDDIMYLPARLSRLDSGGHWSTVPDSGTLFGLFLNGCPGALGTFAVHVDTTTGLAGQVQCQLNLRLRAHWDAGVPLPVWTSTATAVFVDPVRSVPVQDVGGDIKIGALTLTPYGPGFIATTSQRMFDAGQDYTLQVPGSAAVPALDLPLRFLAETPVLTSPTVPGMEVDRSTGFTVTWTGTGPGFTWLLVYGGGLEGFVALGGPTPNDGAFEVTPDDLAHFAPGAQLTVFLQQVRLRPLVATGFTTNSTFMVEISAVATVIVRQGSPSVVTRID